jgi:nitrogen fixation protein NifU and related proteins
MNDIADLYQELIIDHSSRPRNFKVLDAAHSVEGYNPLCGDRLTVYLRMDGDVIVDASFQGEGCAISKASASLMTESIKQKTRGEVEKILSEFRDLVTGVGNPNIKSLGKLAAFSGLREFPIRVKCGMLSWHMLRAALKQETAVVSTE